MTLSIDDAKALVIDFCATYPVASSLGYKLRETQEELYGPHATREAAGTILGSFHPGGGRVLFATSNFGSDEEFKRSLRHEVLGHFGINTFNPAEKRAVLDGIIEARNEPSTAGIWAKVDQLYPGISDSRKAEEVFAFACEDIESLAYGNAIGGAQSFRETCIERSRPMQIRDLISVTTMVAEGLHDRSRSQQIFPASDDAQFKLETTPNTSEYPVWLAVPHDAREVVRAAAGKLENGQAAIGWDKESSLWFARPGADLDRLAQWLPDTSIRSGGGDPEAEFLDALTREGLVIQGMPVMDGQRHRVATVEDKKGNKSGVYRGFLDRRPGGWFINYHRAETEKSVTNWSAKGGESDPMARLHIRAAARQSQEDAVRVREQLYAQQTLAAKRLYDRLPGADPAHPYLVRKGIPPTPDLRQTRNGALVVPFFNASGTFKTLQYIPPDGEKYLFKDAPKQGHFLVVGGSLTPGQPVLYAEGYATARSANLATGLPVVMTIDAGNMVAVAKVLHEQLPDSRHVFLADLDHAKEQNKGLLMATAAAEQVGGQVLYPAFTDEEKARGLTDFNDLHQSRGLDALRNQISQVLAHDNEVPTMQEEKAALDPAATSALVDSVLPPAAPEPLTFTHNGEPATIDLERFQSQPQVEQPAAPSERDIPAAPAPLNFTHNGQPATIDLERFQPQPQIEQPVTPSERDTPTAPAPLAFTHNGEPASLGLKPDPATASSADAVAAVDETTRAQRRAEEQLSMALEPTLAPTANAETVIAPIVQPVERQALESEADSTAPDATPLSPAPSAQTPEQETPVASDDPAPVSRLNDAGNGTSPVAANEADAILVGAPRPSGTEVEPQISHLDLDSLLARVGWEKQGDSQTLYTLDGEPAFVDHGARLEMAPGAGQSDEKIVAALLTAAQFYRGRIELTGSDEFKAKTIGLIAQHQINVEMKNPVQRALLDDARKALTAEPVVRDAIAGEAPPAFGTLPAQPSHAVPEAVPAQPQAAPLLEVENVATVSQSAAPNRAAEPGPENVVAQPQGVSAEVHQPAEKAKDGVVGKVMACGMAPYHFDENNDPTAYIKLRTKTGTQTFWGKELAGLMRETRVQPGKMVTLQWLGKEAVVVKVPHKNEQGVTTHFEDKNAHRNQWALTVKGAATVRTGQDEGVKLAPYDAARFAVVQQAVINRLGLDVPVPTPPAQGLYWMTPNGQGSAKAGDELSAQRPAIDPRKSAGQPVISSWSQDGHLDMLLVRGDGPYLQGVVRQGNEFQHVLVSLPGTQDAPPMVFNAITPEGLVPIGTGNAINRSGGVPVSRENIAFKLEGDNATRIAKLDAPADIPPALHARLGFDERWKEDNSLPKSAPTAAPAAQPSDPRPA